MGRAPITCFIMQIDIWTSENNAAFCTARLQIANETALPAEPLQPTFTASVNSSRGEMERGVAKELSPLNVLTASSLCVYCSPEEEDFCSLTRRGYFCKAEVCFALNVPWFQFVEWGVEEAGSHWALDIDFSCPRATAALQASSVPAFHPHL